MGEFIIGLILGTFGALMLIAFLGEMPASRVKREAVEHGYAEWRVDQKTGASTWVWKIQAEAKP